MANIKCYILQLTSGAYYIGISSNTERRWLEHLAGTGAVVCRKDKPIKKLAEFDTGTKDLKIANYIEDLTLLSIANILGAQKVIGGRYITTDYRRAKGEWVIIERDRILDCLLYHKTAITITLASIYKVIEEIKKV